MRSTLVLLVCFAVCAAGVVAESRTSSTEEYDGPGFPGGGNHPPGVGNHPPGVGRHSPVWSKWRAYRALQAWKKAITEDPENVLESWVGPDVCSYEGVFCSPPEDPELAHLEVVAGIDLNGANLKGCLVPELGLLREIGIFHLNTNRFIGAIPENFKSMKTLFELDLSNNRFSGTFPEVVLEIPNLEFLDIRFNRFYGKLPRELFAKPLDAIFLNNNNFDGELPDSFGQSRSSAIVIANNNLQGSIPKSIANLKETLEEIVVLNNNFHGGLPYNIGELRNVSLFDCSDNRVSGGIPFSIEDMVSLETFDISKNRLSGRVTEELCSLDGLGAVILDDNYFSGVDPSCRRLGDVLSLEGNCLTGPDGQKPDATCDALYPTPPSSPPVLSPPPPVLSPPPPVLSPPPPVFSPPPPNVTSPAPAPSPSACAEGYSLGRNSGTCFMLVEDVSRWDEAEFYCRSQSGGHLAAIETWDQLEDVGSLCSEVDESRFSSPGNPRGLGCYLGGRKPRIPPSSIGWGYPWAPCVMSFNQTFWNNGEPNNRGGYETCLSVKYESREQELDEDKLPYMLNDLSCDVPLPFICALPQCEAPVGCDLPLNPCQTYGDVDASCSTDLDDAVGWTCACSDGYKKERSGTCVAESSP